MNGNKKYKQFFNKYKLSVEASQQFFKLVQDHLKCKECDKPINLTFKDGKIQTSDAITQHVIRAAYKGYINVHEECNNHICIACNRFSKNNITIKCTKCNLKCCIDCGCTVHCTMCKQNVCLITDDYVDVYTVAKPECDPITLCDKTVRSKLEILCNKCYTLPDCCDINWSKKYIKQCECCHKNYVGDSYDTDGPHDDCIRVKWFENIKQNRCTLEHLPGPEDYQFMEDGTKVPGLPRLATCSDGETCKICNEFKGLDQIRLCSNSTCKNKYVCVACLLQCACGGCDKCFCPNCVNAVTTFK